MHFRFRLEETKVYRKFTTRSICTRSFSVVVFLYDTTKRVLILHRVAIKRSTGIGDTVQSPIFSAQLVNHINRGIELALIAHSYKRRTSGARDIRDVSV